MTQSGPEAGLLGGIALGACQDVDRAVTIFVNSTRAFAQEAPQDIKQSGLPAWVRAEHGVDLEPWEKSIRELVKQLSLLMWDAAEHNPRAKLERSLNFSDDLHSKMAAAAVKGMLARSANPDSG